MEVSAYGIIKDSRYVKIEDLNTLKEGEVYISAPFGDKYGIESGDAIVLDEKYEDRQYRFKVAGIND